LKTRTRRGDFLHGKWLANCRHNFMDSTRIAKSTVFILTNLPKICARSKNTPINWVEEADIPATIRRVRAKHYPSSVCTWFIDFFLL